jgi:hypothetical protein
MGAQTALTLIKPDMGFNYGGLDRATEDGARAAAARIKLLVRRTIEDIIQIGQELIDQKKALPGRFLTWLELEFEMSERSAQNFMRVAEQYAGKSATVADLSPKALYELAAPSTPLEVRIEIESRIEAGELVTASDIKRLKADYAEVVELASDKTAQLTAAEQTNLCLVCDGCSAE